MDWCELQDLSSGIVEFLRTYLRYGFSPGSTRAPGSVGRKPVGFSISILNSPMENPDFPIRIQGRPLLRSEFSRASKDGELPMLRFAPPESP